MDDLINSLNSSNLGGGIQKLPFGSQHIYISEVSSPSRMWIQLVDSPYWAKLEEMKAFYNKQGPTDFQLHQVSKGVKVAAYIFDQWDRAEVMSDGISPAGWLKVFFIDFGTVGNVKARQCKVLVEEFAKIPRQTFRAALHGLCPVKNSRLWDLNVIEVFVNWIRNKSHMIQITTYHEQEDSYEFILYDMLGQSVNDQMVQQGFAKYTNTHITYPSFNMLEKLPTYPSYEDRWWISKESGVDFNDFEISNIPESANLQTFEQILMNLLKEYRFTTVKNIITRLFRL